MGLLFPQTVRQLRGAPAPTAAALLTDEAGNRLTDEAGNRLIGTD